MAPAGRYIPKPIDHQVSKGIPSCQSLISPWSKFVFNKTFPSTLAYVILCARVPFLFPLFHYSFLSLILPISTVLCRYHRYWSRPIRCRCPFHRATRWRSAATVTHFRRRLLRRRLPRRALRVYKSVLVPSDLVATDRCWCPCYRATHWCSAATFISSRQAVLRRPRQRPCQDSRCRRRSTSIGLTTQWNRGTYVHAPPHTRRAILFAGLYDTPITGRAVSLYPPIRDLSCYEPQARLNGEGIVGLSVELCRRQLFSLLFLLLLDYRISVSA